MPSSSALDRSETQNSLVQVWTRVGISISYDDNRNVKKIPIFDDYFLLRWLTIIFTWQIVFLEYH